jgi:hypothetical protein
MNDNFVDRFYDKIVVKVEKAKASKINRDTVDKYLEETSNKVEEDKVLIIIFTLYNIVIFSFYFLLFWGKEITQLLRHI